MTLTPEEALRDLAKFSADINREAQLASLGYRLTPIEINEAAVERAARAVCNAQSDRSKFWADGKLIVDRWDFAGGAESETGRYWLANARAAIVAYLEGARARGEQKDGGR